MERMCEGEYCGIEESVCTCDGTGCEFESQ